MSLKFPISDKGAKYRMEKREKKKQKASNTKYFVKLKLMLSFSKSKFWVLQRLQPVRLAFRF